MPECVHDRSSLPPWLGGIAVLVGLKTARTNRVRTRWVVALLGPVIAALAHVPLPSSIRLTIALACLPLARAQAGAVWWLLVSARSTQGVAVRLAPDRELVHKLLWTLFLALDQALVLGGCTLEAWNSTPIGFLVFVAPALVLSAVCLAERALGSALRPRASGWTWLGVQASAAWEELLYRGFAASALWLLLPGNSALLVITAALLFALPHHEHGTPGGVPGLVFAFALGAACLQLDLLAGSILPGFLLHGVLLGSCGVLHARLQRSRVCAGLTCGAALFLLRLRHGYYVTDWAGERVRRLARPDDALATRIRERLSGSDLVAIAPSELGELGDAPRRAFRLPGRDWLRRSGAFLVVATPEGALPQRRFAALGLSVLEALERARSSERRAVSTPELESPAARRRRKPRGDSRQRALETELEAEALEKRNAECAQEDP